MHTLLNGRGEESLNNATVLLVDDEDSVRHSLSSLLEVLGYNVLTARNGHEALGVFRDSSTGIHLLLADMTMPGMTGLDLCGKLLGAHQDLRAILMSGYPSQSLDFDNLSIRQRVRILEKPFQAQTLLNTIRQLLDT